MSTRPLFDAASYHVEMVSSCNWKDGNLTAVLHVAERTPGGPDLYVSGDVTMTCANTEYVLFAEESVADRKDLMIEDGHVQACPNLRSLHVSDNSDLLRRLKHGEDFGEYVNFEARHFIVRTPYNSFEFISSAMPALSEMTTASS